PDSSAGPSKIATPGSINSPVVTSAPQGAPANQTTATSIAVTPKEGDTFEEGTCNLKFKVISVPVNDDPGTVSCIGMINTNVKSLEIPDEITFAGKQFKVTRIGNAAFFKNTNISKVILGSYLTKIGNRSFCCCRNISGIVIPGNVRFIGKQAFANCSRLKRVVIKTRLLKKRTIGKNAFKNIYKKATVRYPKSKRRVYKRIFKKAGF
ncbi:MAG: leucine-rich repeat domain-containing protein, partial [Lachnospiraceae bacterium]|nr:leucine-rich repeat domain-containing protein [Lachnospiraceae bacterium]